MWCFLYWHIAHVLSYELTPKCHYVAANLYVLIAMLTMVWESHFNSFRCYGFTLLIMGHSILCPSEMHKQIFKNTHSLESPDQSS